MIADYSIIFADVFQRYAERKKISIDANDVFWVSQKMNGEARPRATFWFPASFKTLV
jgi:hypothetical protein